MELTVFDLQINEAFASQFAHCVEKLNIPIEKINAKYVFAQHYQCTRFSNLDRGGSIALTHPLGMSESMFH